MAGDWYRTRRAAAARAAALALVAVLVCQPVAAASESEASEDEVRRLRAEAVERFASTTPDAAGMQRIIAGWQAVIEAAARISPNHPEIAPARIRIASQLYSLGRNAEARASVEEGLAALPEGDAATLITRAEGVALLGTLLVQAGDADIAIAALEQGYADYMEGFSALPPDEIGRDDVISKSNLEFSLSQTLLQLSRPDEALAYQLASLKTREAFLGPNDPDTIGSYYGYAGTLRRVGDMEEAERFARIAVERAVAHVDPAHPSYARALEMLAIVLSRTGRPIEATNYLARSLELKRENEGPDSLFFGYGIHLLATIYHQRERYADAVPLFEEAGPIFARYQGEGSPFGLGSAGYAAQGTFALGRQAEALDRLRTVDALMEAQSIDADIAKRIGPDLVRALIRGGGHGEAARIAARDLRRLQEAEDPAAFALRHARLVEAWARSALAAHPIDALPEARAMLAFLSREQTRKQAMVLVTEQRAALDLVMEIAVATGDADMMAKAVALATGSGLAQASALRAERITREDPSLAEALRLFQQADADLEAADLEVLRALATGVPSAAALARLAEAEGRRNAALAGLQARDPDAGHMLASADIDIATIRAELRAGEALLAIAPAYDGAYSLLVTPTQVQARRLELPRAELVALAETVRDGAANLSFDAAASARLAALLLPPETRAALQGSTTLRILAGGPLASLPFGLLLLEMVGPTSTKAQWLADRFALVSVPSFERRPAVARAEGNGFVAFAAPVPFAATRQSDGAVSMAAISVGSPAAYFARGGPDLDRLSALPPLPGSEREARTIADDFGEGKARIFVGADATKAQLSHPSVRAAEVLLFATHGLVGGEIEGIAEPALVLSPPSGGGGDDDDGILRASEIARLTLSADWVILTACDSAAGFEGGVPAFSGLVSAFRFAGGGSILATHWQVRDDAAAYVAIATLQHYREHGDKARALQHAVQRLRYESGLPGAEKPEIWAPFVLID